jgi:hypothetical protein
MMQYVTYEDILFVEKKIKSLKCYPTPNELWKEMRGRFKTKAELGTIIEYLLNKNRIILDNIDGKIIWIWNPKLAKRILLNRSLLIV